MSGGRPFEISPWPWQASYHNSGKAIADANGLRIASLQFARGTVSAKVTNEECTANQRLMIRAPELLETLRLALSVLRECSEEAGDVDRWNEGGDGYEAAKVARELLGQIDRGRA